MTRAPFRSQDLAPAPVAHGVRVDLSDVSCVVAADGSVAGLVDRGAVGDLDAVVLSAAAQLTDRRRVRTQGCELTLAVSALAQHALRRGLEDRLATGATPCSRARAAGSTWRTRGRWPAPDA